MKLDYYYKNLHLSLVSVSHDIVRFLLPYIERGVVSSVTYDFNKEKTHTLQFLAKMKYGKSIGVYRYSESCSIPNLYSSVYACMTLSLYGELEKMSASKKQEWLNYLDSFQSESDGLFRDNSIKNDIFEDSDWWGARHLTAHVITAYTQLGGKPKYRFGFLDKYLDDKELQNMFSKISIDNPNSADDNKLMNLAVLMQYSRDTFKEVRFGHVIKRIFSWLDTQINQKTGLWGNIDINNKEQLSRAVQFTYHILCLYLFDKRKISNSEALIANVQKTQHALGGFGAYYNSSACEDIDSIFLLCKLSGTSGALDDYIKPVLAKAFTWVLANKNDDGGFAFKLAEPFTYGHTQMSSEINQSGMFPTWFRTLSLAYLTKYLKIKNDFRIIRCPGVEQ